MENVTEALKIAFGVMMFVLALTLSISSFSQAREAIDSVIMIKDREQEYTYVKTSSSMRNRLVSAETIIPTIYRAYKENFSVEFYKADGVTPLYLYTDIEGNNNINTYYFDLQRENFGNAEDAYKHLDILLEGQTAANSAINFSDKLLYTNGLYKFFEDSIFTEYIGEYYQEDAAEGTITDTLEINKTKKRVITYVLKNTTSLIIDP